MSYLQSTYVKGVYPTAYRSATYDPQADNTTEYNVTNAVKRIGERNYVVFYDNSVSGTEIALKVSIAGYMFEISKEGVVALKNAAGSGNNIYLYIRLSNDADYKNNQLLPADDDSTSMSDLDVVVYEGDTNKYFCGLGYATSTSGLGDKPYLHVFNTEGNVPSTSFGILDTTKIVDKTGDTNEKSLAERVTTQDLDVNGPADITGVVTLTNTTDSSSKTTGAVKISGGVGIGKKLYVGSHADIGGRLTVKAEGVISGSLTVGVTNSNTILTSNGDFYLNGNQLIKGMSGQPYINFINKANAKTTTVTSSTVTDNRIITLPNKSGIVRVTGDVTNGPSAKTTVSTSSHTHSFDQNCAATPSTSTVNAFTSGSTTPVMTGVKVNITSVAPADHTHSYKKVTGVNMSINEISSGGASVVIGGIKNTFMTGVKSTGTFTAAPGAHSHTYSKANKVDLTNNTGICHGSYSGGVLTLTSSNLEASLSYSTVTSGNNSGTNTSVVTGVDINGTAAAYTSLTTKYVHATVSDQDATSEKNSGTNVDAVTSVAVNGTADAYTSLTTTGVAKSDHVHNMTVTTGQPSATVDVASNLHTHTLVDQ